MENLKTTILVIDDDIVDFKFVKKALEKSRVSNKIVGAGNGEEGLKILREASHKESFVVLLDLNMPRMDGHEFLEELRGDDELKNTIVFVLTTSNDDADKWKAYQKNITGYLLKQKLEDEFVKKILMIDHFLLAIEMPPRKKPIL